MKLILGILVVILNFVLPASPHNPHSNCRHLESTCKIKLLENKKEKADLLNRCTNATDFAIKASYLTIKDLKIDSIKSFKSCPLKNQWLVFGWMPFKKYIEDSSEDLKFENYQLITRKEDGTTNFTYDLYSNQDDAFNNSGPLSRYESYAMEVLIEIVPSSYQLDEITYKLWKNTILEYKIPMKTITLTNDEYQSNYIVEDIHYIFNQTIKLNLTDTLECEYNIPGDYKYDNHYINLNKGGFGQFFRNKSLEFSYDLPPRSAINVTLVADWIINEYLFNANLKFQYYDYEFSSQMFGALRNDKKVTITKISNVQVIYGKPIFIDQQVENFSPIVEETNLNSSPDKGYYQQSPIERPILPEEPTEAPIEREIETVYPGFEPYFIAGCIVVGLAITLACGGMIKSLADDRKKAQYQEVSLRKV